MLITNKPKITKKNTGLKNAITNDSTLVNDNSGTIKYHLGGFKILS
ncbi:MAG: hypothetical protein WBI53_03545 [Paludibacter sp.]